MTGADDIVDAAAQAGPAEPPVPNDRALADEPRNDIGNARRLVARHGHELCHVDETGWHRYDGRRWQPPLAKAAPEAVLLAQHTSEAIRAEAQALRDELVVPARAAVKALRDAGHGPVTPEMQAAQGALARAEARGDKQAGWSVQSGNMARIMGMLSAAAPMLRVRPGELDRDAGLLNVANGTLVLSRDGIRLRAHDRADRITRLSPVVYDPHATCPTWERFLSEAQPDKVLRRFLQAWHGYCLTGDVSEQVIVLNHGTGANGKSTFLGLVAEAMGDYCVTVPIETFLFDDRRRGGEATPEIVPLISARLALASEPEGGARLSEALAKRITGGEKMTLRRLYEGMIEFDPVFKLTLSFNRQPRITGQDEGTWRRFLLLPWRAFFPKDQQDRGLKAKLRAELPGILNWLLAGLRDWQQNGLVVPDEVRAATDQYRHDSDPVGQYLEALVVERVGATLQSSRLYNVYRKWSKANGVREVNSTVFGRQLTDRGIVRQKTGGHIVYLDLEFNREGLEELEGATLPGEAAAGPSDPLGEREGGR